MKTNNKAGQNIYGDTVDSPYQPAKIKPKDRIKILPQREGDSAYSPARTIKIKGNKND